MFKAIHFDDRIVPNAYFSVIVGGVMTGVLCLIGARYAALVQAEGKRPGLARLPVAGINTVDTSVWDGWAYQVYFLAAYVLVPLGGQVHFWDKLITFGHGYSEPMTGSPTAPWIGPSRSI